MRWLSAGNAVPLRDIPLLLRHACEQSVQTLARVCGALGEGTQAPARVFGAESGQHAESVAGMVLCGGELVTKCKPWCRFAAAVDALESGAGDSEWRDLSFCNLHLAGTDAKSRKVGRRSMPSALSGGP